MPDSLSYLDLINLCDNVHVPLTRTSEEFGDVEARTGLDAEELIPFHLSLHDTKDKAIIGLLRPIIIQTLISENKRSRRLGKPEIWELNYLDDSKVLIGGKARVSFSRWVNEGGYQRRTEVMKELCERWRDEAIFENVCGMRKWRGEMYPVYKNPFGVHDHPAHRQLELRREREMNYAFEMERSACALFGIVTYGVHMSIYEEKVNEGGKKSVSVWVPTRARTKQTFPGLLDNTVAGGIPSGMGIFESMVKECMEEASLEASIVDKYARATGVISYFFRTSEGWLQPEVEYVYDIEIPGDENAKMFKPKPSDGEVESFEFMSQDKVTEKLRAGMFKPNCGLVLIDLLMRLGYITPDNEDEYMEIATRLRGRFRYEAW